MSVAEVLTQVGAVTGPIVSAASAAFASAWAAIVAVAATLPYADVVSAYYTQIFGPTTAYEMVVDVFPIMYVTVFPLLCVLCTLCGMCAPKGSGPKGSGKPRLGHRVLSRVNLAVRGGVRIYKGISGKKQYKGITSLSDAEAGRGKTPTNKSPPTKGKGSDKKKNDRRY